MKKFLKRIVSLVLVVVMAVSTMAVAVVSTSASAQNEKTYKIFVYTGGGFGKSIDSFVYRVYGEKGYHELHFGTAAKTSAVHTFKCADLGRIQSVVVSRCYSGTIDDIYINQIIVEEVGKEKTTITCGAWVGKEYGSKTFWVGNKVVKLTVNTSEKWFSGTDDDVSVVVGLESSDGNLEHTTRQLNLSEIHPAINAFEMKDSTTFYIDVPEYIDELKYVKFLIHDTDNIIDDWRIASVEADFNGKSYAGVQSEVVINESSKDKFFPYCRAIIDMVENNK